MNCLYCKSNRAIIGKATVRDYKLISKIPVMYCPACNAYAELAAHYKSTTTTQNYVRINTTTDGRFTIMFSNETVRAFLQGFTISFWH